ncbi:esterase [Hoeflea sp. BAL378]|uniref:extracellular catalytic domain type 1 short-chain-length polyhydroxyalkanoate depolymerase n=1 Tax=Hoeflea sp. BAL378 TaxID=1547437 RepID=UPI000513ADD4|nr:PHB depolymerase family esterase [Hoeflea sp. BAL378]KGF68212.1 esterase [Hoeflea sp. BAL378]
MKLFDAGALRPGTTPARLSRFASAADLVNRTLARHGLAFEAAGNEGAELASPLMRTPAGLAGLQAGLQSRARQDAPLPEGAQFRQEQYECAAGSRAFRTYVPSSAARGVTGIVLMLHGCTQTAEDFAAGTGMNALAERHGFVAVYPQQARGNNAQSCWNWFSRGDQRRDRGEPAILAGLTARLMAEFEVPAGRVFAAGLSAGAAMAVILGETYPDVFSAIGVHSGIPFAAAGDVPSAFAAMAGRSRAATAPDSPDTALRSIVFHGTTDTTVHPVNGELIAERSVARHRGPTIETVQRGTAGGRSFARTITTMENGIARLEHWVIDGLGHAWSGGSPAGTYTDPRGPDSSREMIRFFFEAPE